MRQNPDERLFANEVEFVHFLAQLMAAHPGYSNVQLEPLLGSRDVPEQRFARADIIARRADPAGVQTLLIECKNRPIYGPMVDEVITQLQRYGAMRPGVRLVLALPSSLAERDAAHVRAAAIELWIWAESGANSPISLQCWHPTSPRPFHPRPSWPRPRSCS